MAVPGRESGVGPWPRLSGPTERGHERGVYGELGAMPQCHHEYGLRRGPRQDHAWGARAARVASAAIEYTELTRDGHPSMRRPDGEGAGNVRAGLSHPEGALIAGTGSMMLPTVQAFARLVGGPSGSPGADCHMSHPWVWTPGSASTWTRLSAAIGDLAHPRPHRWRGA